MKSQNPIKSWRRNILGVAVVVSVGAAAYLLLDKDGNKSSVHDLSLPAGEPNSIKTASIAEDSSGGVPASGKAGRGLQAQKPTAGRVLLKMANPPAGSPLPEAGANPDADKGRVARLSPVDLSGWSELHAGSVVVLPSFVEADSLEGSVNLVEMDSGWFRIGGALAGREGSFSLSSNGNEVSGRILLPETGVGYTIRMDAGVPVLVEQRLSSMVCYPGMNRQMAAATSDGVARRAVAAAVNVPLINTRPGAKGVIYVDFDGETVTDPDWNAGRTINAAPTSLASADYTQILELSAQDYAQFDVTLTTNRSVYDAAAPGTRMRVVVTPTDTAAPGAGGVAYVNSWSGAGSALKSDALCWVFNQGVRGIAEALSHEVGHTLGLNHDGQIGGTEYYSGHGGTTTVPTSWAPIMGVGYSRSLVQWSKGEYARANNTEDDLAILGRAANKFGLIQSELPNGSKSLSLSGETFRNIGLIRNQDSVDSYTFSTSGGAFSASVQPEMANSDLDVSLELLDASGNTLQLADPSAAIGAVLNKTLPSGTYRLVVRGAGTGAKPSGGYTTGYSAYGSTGRYVLSGSLQGGASLPSFTSPRSITGSVGSPLSASIGVSAGASVSVVSSALPAGLSFDPKSLVLSGTPTKATGSGTPGAADGPGLLRLAASNASGSITAEFVVAVLPASLPLADAFPSGSVLSTAPAAPWSGVSLERADGKAGTVARSGLIPNNGVTSLAFEYAPPAASNSASSVMTFYWRASTEPLSNRNRSGDFVQCRVNGSLASDADSGRALILSGETGWVKQTVRLRGSGTQKIEFIYAKDASLSAGQDRVWVYVTSIGQLPSVTAQPVSVQLKAGEQAFTLSATVAGADSLVWKRNFVTLVDGTSSSGSVVSGAKTGELKVASVSGADVGYYWLEASNAYGSVITMPVSVVIAVAPVIIQQPAAPVSLKVGDPLLLSAEVTSATRIRYRWIKDGLTTAWRNADPGSIVLSIPQTKTDAAGRYQLVVSNSYGEVISDEVQVSFSSSTTAKKKL